MKNYLPFILMFTTLNSYSQSGYDIQVVSASNDDRMNLIKNSVSISEWHEKSFWSLYRDYSDKIDQSFLDIGISLDSLLKENGGASSKRQFELASRLVAATHQAFDVRRHFFVEMGASFNGVIALEFLQAEAIMSVLENLKIFENNSTDFSFYPWLLDSGEVRNARGDAIRKALKLSSEEVRPFFAVYTRYEKERDDLLGEDYNLFELFNEEPSDFTPALAKVQGHNLLRLMQREVLLKERYFREMNKEGGPSLAARFILWEDYYSTINKMYAWSDNAN